MRTVTVVWWMSFVLLPATPAVSLRAQQPCEPDFAGGDVLAIPANFGMNALADFDADGHLDLSVGIDILLGDGTGAFPRTVQLDAPWEVAFDEIAEDLDKDGFLDAVLVGFSTAEILLFRGREDDGASGFFEPGVSLTEPSEWRNGFWHLARADFNADGWTDIVAISRSRSHALLMSNEGRSFDVSLFPAETSGHMIATGDFDGDGNDDVALGSGETVILYAGMGDGTFTAGPAGTLRVGDSTFPGHRFRSADADGDGRSDLFATAATQVVVYLGADIDSDTLALPRQPSRVLPVLGAARFIEIADLNGDEVLDVASLSSAGESTYRIFYGYETPDGIDFAGALQQPTDLDVGGVLGLGDVNADDAIDLAVTTEGSFHARVFLNDASCYGGRYQRGDANRDGARNLTDAVAILSHLFLGGELPCPGAAETDGNAALDLTDAVYLLNFLFLGGDGPVGEELVACDA